jgi:hypothetical protein
MEERAHAKRLPVLRDRVSAARKPLRASGVAELFVLMWLAG